MVHIEPSMLEELISRGILITKIGHRTMLVIKSCQYLRICDAYLYLFNSIVCLNVVFRYY